MDPYSPGQLQAEGNIRELKRDLVGILSELVQLNEYGMMHFILRLMGGPIHTWMFICCRDESLRQ